jgi:hypothetical protein
MNVSEYIPKDEVRSACKELGIRDWTQLSEPNVKMEEAQKIQAKIGAEAERISTEAFRQGLEVELEHGLQFSDANVTNNHPILTGMIVLAHLKEMLDYYERLEVAELEGDLLKAIRSGNPEKIRSVYRKLVAARQELAEQEARWMEEIA